MPLAKVIELFAKCFNENTLKMSKEFTIVEVVEQTYGKWGEVLGNAFWTESDHFFDNMLEMGQATLYRLTGQDADAGPNIDLEFKDTVEELVSLFKGRFPTDVLQKEAIFVMGKLDKSENTSRVFSA